MILDFFTLLFDCIQIGLLLYIALRIEWIAECHKLTFPDNYKSIGGEE